MVFLRDLLSFFFPCSIFPFPVWSFIFGVILRISQEMGKRRGEWDGRLAEEKREKKKFANDETGTLEPWVLFTARYLSCVWFVPTPCFFSIYRKEKTGSQPTQLAAVVAFRMHNGRKEEEENRRRRQSPAAAFPLLPLRLQTPMAAPASVSASATSFATTCLSEGEEGKATT